LIAARTIAASFIAGATLILESVPDDHNFASKTKLDCGRGHFTVRRSFPPVNWFNLCDTTPESNALLKYPNFLVHKS